MQTRHAILTLFALAVVGIGSLAFLGSKKKLPPQLEDAYGTVAALASSASEALATSHTAADGPDAGDAGPAIVRRTTQTAPLSSAQLAEPLVHGRFVSECGAPDTMKVAVKVSIKKGRAVAVAVTTTPANAAVASCVEKATRDKEWDVSPKTQHVTVTY
jgi:hypothetical protein